MATVMIGSQVYVVYADIPEADLYLDALATATNWRAADDDTKAMYLVTATRVLDRQRWKGTKTAADQDLAWPRTGTGVTGVVDDEIPDNIITASIEMANMLADGSELQTDQSIAQKIQQLSAGSVSLTFFRGAEGAALRFPLPIMELIRDYLASTRPVLGGGFFGGTDGESVTGEDFGLNGGL